MKFSRFFKKYLKKQWVQAVGAYLVAQYMRFIYVTSRWAFEGIELPHVYRSQKKSFIICFWHGRLFLLCAAWKKVPSPFYMLMSPHADAGINIRTARYFGVRQISGSSGKKGLQAMRAMLKTLQEGHVVGITPEGLRGPYQVVGEGLVRLAQLSQCDVFPVAFATSRYRILPSWDRFFVPFPFSQGALVCGAPISPLGESDAEKLREKITEGLIAATHRADQLCGISSV